MGCLADFLEDFDPEKEVPATVKVLKSNAMHVNTDILKNMISLDSKFKETQTEV